MVRGQVMRVVRGQVMRAVTGDNSDGDVDSGELRVKVTKATTAIGIERK